VSDDDYIHACWGMEKYGGDFSKRLAHLYYIADRSNMVLLQVTFNSYFEQGLGWYERHIGTNNRLGGPAGS
jgi:hypothetical protein